MARRLSLPEHGAVELLVGVALIAAPFVLEFGPAGLLTSMAAGAVIAGLAVSETSISAHMAGDAVVAAALLGVAVALAAAGESVAGGVLAAAGAGELALGMATRWTRRV
jgi:hypothetical protein